MPKLDAMIANELKRRGQFENQDKEVLTHDQYELLRRRGRSKKRVAAFEALLIEEIKEKNKGSSGILFIPSEYVKHRVRGKAPDEIDYDLCHASR